MTQLNLRGSLILEIDKNIQIDISEERIVINDFSGKSHVVVTGGENMDMIHHDDTHTLAFNFKKRKHE